MDVFNTVNQILVPPWKLHVAGFRFCGGTNKKAVPLGFRALKRFNISHFKRLPSDPVV